MSEFITPRICPGCGTALGFATGLSGAVKPKTGDYSLCSVCFEVSEFTETGYSLLTSEQWAAMDEKTRSKLRRTQQELQSAAYSWQLDQMLNKARAWRKANPEREVIIQYNFPSNVAVAGSISLAIERKFMTVDAAGMELIKALWPWDTRSEPTVLMVKMVLDAAYERTPPARGHDISGGSGATGLDSPPRK